ncbi:DUF1643 domain-containing protein [Clostridium sartagoforme]|uniref:DUF1643 domain-containing protein n=1 Tax=Clostridium sartagoforme AAU1 TaxID=1202534 RepID=R9BS19_9CLOT|nr:DUF1643 domain-containing protein [Clostridium sartagoforme]EOR19838.1 hypothetical protein A500_19927 [Clostridium sartagoforme AAU1]
MIKEYSSTIYNKAIFSEDKNHRYLLERVWDENKAIATVIMLNPSYAGHIKVDNTTSEIINYLVDLELDCGDGEIITFGGLKVVNIFSYIVTKSKELKNIDYYELFDSYTDNEIVKAFEESKIIIIAWGKEDKKLYRERKNKIRSLLKQKYSDKVFYFINPDGSPSSHPSIMQNGSKIKEYDFTSKDI